MYCLVGISACMSLMFRQSRIALEGLGDEVKLGSAGLIMATWRIFAPLQALIIDWGIMVNQRLISRLLFHQSVLL